MSSSNTRKRGEENEQRAVEFLSHCGFTILDRNVSFKTGELDIIAIKGGVLHSVEVKSGKSFDPIYNVTPAKIHKVIQTTQWYMKTKGITSPFVIDVVLVRNGVCELIENITM